jgi:hypothetical protein
MNKRGVARSVRSLDLDVRFDHLKARCRGRLCRRGKARRHQEGCKVAPCDVSGMRVIRLSVFLVVCHGFSFNEFNALGHPDGKTIFTKWMLRTTSSEPRTTAFPYHTLHAF